MTAHLRTILHEPELAQRLSQHGRETILRRHTCAHRVDELLGILQTLGKDDGQPHARPEPAEGC